MTLMLPLHTAKAKKWIHGIWLGLFPLSESDVTKNGCRTHFLVTWLSLSLWLSLCGLNRPKFKTEGASGPTQWTSVQHKLFQKSSVKKFWKLYLDYNYEVHMILKQKVTWAWNIKSYTTNTRMSVAVNICCTDGVSRIFFVIIFSMDYYCKTYYWKDY